MPRHRNVNIENRRRRSLIRDLMRIRRNNNNNDNNVIGQTNRNPDNYGLGQLNNVCRFCYSLYFNCEKKANGLYTSCCHNGKVTLPVPQTNELIQNLLTGNHQQSRNFMSNIRSYNNSFAMVSASGNIRPNTRGGPYVYVVNGQVHHRIGITPNVENQNNSRYGQVYFYDSEEASNIRCSIRENENCDPNLMQELSNVFQEINPYSQAFKTLGQVLRETPLEQRENVRMVIYSDRQQDKRRYNLPTSNDVAAIFKADDGCPVGNPEFVIYPKNGAPETIAPHCSGLDPMAYPLLFPYGEQGWFRGMPQVQERATAQRNKVTQLQFASHRLSVRQQFSSVLHAGKISLQYIVDMFTRIEGERLAFIRSNQSKLRAEMYVNLHDAIRAQADNEGLNIGRQVILPRTFQGSFRNMHSNYLDAMAIVRQYGKPDLFITFTCNPNWDEIKENLMNNETANMRPDLIVRVFNGKLKELLKDLQINEVFGKVSSLIYTIEFQKRGLPHCHILLTLEADFKIREINQIDATVWAEIPDSLIYPELHNIVIHQMIHGPCGLLNLNSPCMQNGNCIKGYPKPFYGETRENVNGYPVYRRRENGVTATVRGLTIDNRSVVPYNPYLTKKYNAHINVEICSTVKSIKYIYKYIYKGFDSASIEFRNGNTLEYDEVKGYLNARWVGSSEAMWRILEYPMHYQSHTVVNLECHLQNQQRVTFIEGNEERALDPKDTKLMAWFVLNQRDPDARLLTYTEIPKHYTWKDSEKCWKSRQRGSHRIVTRLNVVSAKNVELFHLRLLLLHIKGAQNFIDLRTINGQVYDTYREAAIAYGIAESCQLSRDTLQEATLHASPYNLRTLFAWLLGLNVPTDSLDLWNDYKCYMTEDFTHQGLTEENALNSALLEIEEILITHNTSCNDLGLPVPIRQHQLINLNNQVDEAIFNELYTKANDEQKPIIDLIIRKVQEGYGAENLFYLDAPAGCGKTFIQRTLLAKLASDNLVALPVAFTGIAASLIEKGRTLHNQFKLPIPVLEDSVSGVTPNSSHGRFLDSVKLIIIDEASMVPSFIISVIDRLFKDLTNNRNLKKLPFAGKVVLFSGDFRQTLPVVPHAGRSFTVLNCLKNNKLWPLITQLKLEKNMRVNDGEDEFAKYLLNVGNGSLPTAPNGYSLITKKLLGVGSPIDFIYSDIEDSIVQGRIKYEVILAPKNVDCDVINQSVLSRLPGDERVYESIDTLITDNMVSHLELPVEYLNSIEVSGLPKNKLSLKEGSIVLLMRNLNTAKGLINGTRLQVKRLYNNTIDCKVLTGSSKGESVLIPRVKLIPSETTLPFKMQRNQFPITLAFAMTINKAQGQSFSKVAIYLPKPVFTHGQLYVALSRAKSFNSIKIFINETQEQQILQNGDFTTANVVFNEVLM